MSASVLDALPRLNYRAANALRLYYQAAVYLKWDVESELQQYSDDVATLPELFSMELSLPAPGTVTTDAALTALGEVHAHLSS